MIPLDVTSATLIMKWPPITTTQKSHLLCHSYLTLTLAIKQFQFPCAASQRRRERDLLLLTLWGRSIPMVPETLAAQAPLIHLTPALILPLCAAALPTVHLDSPTTEAAVLAVLFTGQTEPVCPPTRLTLWDHALYRRCRGRANPWMVCRWTALIALTTRQKTLPTRGWSGSQVANQDWEPAVQNTDMRRILTQRSSHD